MQKSSVKPSALLGALLRSVVLFLTLMSVFLGALILTQGDGRGWIAAAVTAAVGAIVVQLIRRQQRARRAPGWAWLSLVAAAILAGVVCIPTVSTSRVLPSPLRNVSTQHWTLSTGSVVAVYHYPAKTNSTRRSVPLLYLHGGPTRSISLQDHRFLATLASHGYNVYAYEQAGAGRSGMLAMSSYSIDRELADLNAVIERMHAGKVDVMGFSAGGSLLARAVADPATEAHLDKAIIAEPGPMDGPTAAMNGRLGKPNAARIAPPMGGPRSISEPRYAVAFGLMKLGILNPDNQLVPQAEALNAFTAADLGSDTASGYCAKDAKRIPVEDSADNFTFNVAASTQVQNSIRSAPSIAAKLAKSTTPAMLMMAECSAQVRGWETSIIREDPAITRVQYMPGVGHHMWNGLDQNNERAYEVINAFLNERTAPLPNYPTKADLSEFNNKRE
jgi:alpha-beta hydrolase superfamily lysophospholipase/uncharacterized membrane protein YeaQ/YmgE (transglycosylase-associated protein family)